MKYYVYLFQPTAETPEWHYGFFSMTLDTEALPDIREHIPKWIYDDVANSYIEIKGEFLWRY